MDWVLSNAHLELLISDQPIVVYNRSKDTDKMHTKKEMDDVLARWKAKREAQGKSTSFKIGEKVNLNEFLRTGMDAFKNDTKIE